MFGHTIKTLAVALLALAASASAEAASIVVGGKAYTEQHVMAEMTKQLLEAKGFTVDKRAGLGTAVLRQAQESGQLDLYWEYTGTSLITFNKVKDKLTPAETYDKVKALDAEKGLVWLDPSKVNSTYALALRKDDAAAKKLATYSDLAAYVKAGNKVKLGSSPEFYARPDGLKPMEEAYGFSFDRDSVIRMDFGLIYQALRDSQLDVGLVIATDGRVQAYDFLVLKDDKSFFPFYAMTPVIRKETLDANPELAGILNQLSAKLDDTTITKLNAGVDVEKKTVEAVASEFLKASGLI